MSLRSRGGVGGGRKLQFCNSEMLQLAIVTKVATFQTMTPISESVSHISCAIYSYRAATLKKRWHHHQMRVSYRMCEILTILIIFILLQFSMKLCNNNSGVEHLS